MNDFLQRRQTSEDHLSKSTDNASAFDIERRKDVEDFDKYSLSVIKSRGVAPESKLLPDKAFLKKSKMITSLRRVMY